MPRFSQISLSKLLDAEIELQNLFSEIIKYYDCIILETYRDENRQNALYNSGMSQKKWPNGKHNVFPSKAADVAPYPVDFNDLKRYYHFAGYVQSVANYLGIDIRWGGDWDCDKKFNDQKFNDLCHFELL